MIGLYTAMTICGVPEGTPQSFAKALDSENRSSALFYSEHIRTRTAA